MKRILLLDSKRLFPINKINEFRDILHTQSDIVYLTHFNELTYESLLPFRFIVLLGGGHTDLTTACALIAYVVSGGGLLRVYQGQENESKELSLLCGIRLNTYLGSIDMKASRGEPHPISNGLSTFAWNGHKFNMTFDPFLDSDIIFKDNDGRSSLMWVHRYGLGRVACMTTTLESLFQYRDTKTLLKRTGLWLQRKI